MVFFDDKYIKYEIVFNIISEYILSCSYCGVLFEKLSSNHIDNNFLKVNTSVIYNDYIIRLNFTIICLHINVVVIVVI